MVGAAVRGRLNWLVAEAVEFIDETARVRSIVLDRPEWPGHLPGQHIDLRLTAEDGYQAQRSYSIAAPADGGRVVVTVEQVDKGEVSAFLRRTSGLATASNSGDRSAATSSGSHPVEDHCS